MTVDRLLPSIHPMNILALAALIATPALAAGPDGAALFGQNCSACHQAEGQGIPGAFPALAGDKFVVGDAKAVAAKVLHGKNAMPAFSDSLNDAEIAAILTHVRSHWGNNAPPVTAADVTAARSAK